MSERFKKFQALDSRGLKSSRSWTDRARFFFAYARRGDGKKSGFTLIEVLLAMAILGICVTGLLVSVSNCLAVARRAKLYDDARNLIARVELERPLLLEKEFKEGVEEGGFDGGPDGFKWRREIEVVEMGDDIEAEFNKSKLFKITTRVSWEYRDKTAFEEVTTYLYRPDAEE